MSVRGLHFQARQAVLLATALGATKAWACSVGDPETYFPNLLVCLTVRLVLGVALGLVVTLEAARKGSMWAAAGAVLVTASNAAVWLGEGMDCGTGALSVSDFQFLLLVSAWCWSERRRHPWKGLLGSVVTFLACQMLQPRWPATLWDVPESIWSAVRLERSQSPLPLLGFWFLAWLASIAGGRRLGLGLSLGSRVLSWIVGTQTLLNTVWIVTWSDKANIAGMLRGMWNIAVHGGWEQ